MGESILNKKIPQKLLDIAGVAREDVNRARAFRRTAEHKQNCEPFEQLSQKYFKMKQQYVDSFDALEKDVVSNVCRREYARGGELLHRGFYSPSCQDLVIGNCSRGRLVKKQPSADSGYYEYLFDSQDRLICVYKYDRSLSAEWNPVSTEFILYQGDDTLSLQFDSPEYRDIRLFRRANTKTKD